jgi:hypothetical protein
MWQSESQNTPVQVECSFQSFSASQLTKAVVILEGSVRDVVPSSKQGKNGLDINFPCFH